MVHADDSGQWVTPSCCPPNGDQPKNNYALVSYIPEPLRTFLDELRLKLVKGCRPAAHVTVLPPRPLPENLGPDLAWNLVRSRVCDLPTFDIEITEVDVFEKTSVVHLGIGRGREKLLGMHEALNAGPLQAEEEYNYEPHITLAQNFEPERLDEINERARQEWALYPHSRTFSIESLTFVQNTIQNKWLDLARCSLPHLAVSR